jgi:hypothetical protein
MSQRRLLPPLLCGLILVGYAGVPAPSWAIARAAEDISALWNDPSDLETRDLFHGNWGASHAPNPDAVYTFVRTKKGGANPGVVVRDSIGRTWHVKQADGSRGAEGPVEVALSRVLNAVGYHQPPVYFLPSFTMMTSDGQVQREAGGRFRLDDPSLRDLGVWSWQDNPFIGTPPFDGLLVILLMFNSWDLKDSNNTLYDVRREGEARRWYVVRDLGGALGETGRFRPKRNHIDKFERHIFITNAGHDLVEFGYDGKQPQLIRHRITVDTVSWAASLMSRLDDRQWNDAFRAGGYDQALGNRFIAKIRANIAQARLRANRTQ